MKIIRKDNYDRETIADVLVAENIVRAEEGSLMVDALNSQRDDPSWWYVLVEDDYRLGRGMEDLV